MFSHFPDVLRKEDIERYNKCEIKREEICEEFTLSHILLILDLARSLKLLFDFVREKSGGGEKALGVLVNQISPRLGVAPLFLSNSMATLKLLLRCKDINLQVQDHHGDSLLISLVRKTPSKDRFNIFQELISHAADKINTPNNVVETAVMLAARNVAQYGYFIKLVEMGAH